MVNLQSQLQVHEGEGTNVWGRVGRVKGWVGWLEMAGKEQYNVIGWKNRDSKNVMQT